TPEKTKQLDVPQQALAQAAAEQANDENFGVGRQVDMEISEGKPYPLGATWDGLGVNFALFSENATKVELCLFDSVDATKESIRIVLPERNAYVWHGYIKGLRPGQLYAYRVYGPYEPENGLRFNPNKLVTDPYAKSIVRGVRWDDSLFAYRIGDPDEDLT